MAVSPRLTIGSGTGSRMGGGGWGCLEWPSPDDWGIGRNTLRNYERDIRLPQSAVLARIAEAGGVSVDWLPNGHAMGYLASTSARVWEAVIEVPRDTWAQPRRRRLLAELLRALRDDSAESVAADAPITDVPAKEGWHDVTAHHVHSHSPGGSRAPMERLSGRPGPEAGARPGETGARARKAARA